MNTYVMIARHLGKVSGEKIYCNNKLRYMVSQGWRVFFLSGKHESTLVDDSPLYTMYSNPMLSYTPEIYSKWAVEHTLRKITSLIGNVQNDLCIIESDSVNRGVWGELIAKRIGAQHFMFLLQEKHNYPQTIKQFLRYKYDRHELAGITTRSISLMLGDDSVEQREDTTIRAFCTNVVEDCADTISPQLLKDATFTFGSIGRLDKGCVDPILQGIKTYAGVHKDEKFNLVLIGGATGPQKIREIREGFRDNSNIHLIITGYMYPIPITLINSIDLFISTAGSALVSFRCHRPTIKVHPTTGDPVGILGLGSSENKMMYEIMPDVSIYECIEKAISELDQIDYWDDSYADYEAIMSKEFERQISFANREKEKVYYDERQLIKIKPTHIKNHKLHRIVGHLAGAKALDLFVILYKKTCGV